MKVARTVLRGVGRSDASRLPDQELGGQVRKGETAEPSIYFNSTSKTDVDQATGEETSKTIRFMRSYSVFNGAP